MTSVAIVDDERVVLAGLVRLWDLTTGEEVRTIRDEALVATIDVVDGMLAIASGDEVTVGTSRRVNAASRWSTTTPWGSTSAPTTATS